MLRISIKKAPLCLALTLFALPAMADSIFSGIATFGREILDETRKLAPGIQNDRRYEEPADVRAALDDGRDRPAIEGPNSNVAVVSVGQGRANQGHINQGRTNQGHANGAATIEVAPPVNGQPTGSNLNYTYGDSQRSTASNAQQEVNAGYQQDLNQGQDQAQSQNQSNANANFGWQEENNLR